MRFRSLQGPATTDIKDDQLRGRFDLDALRAEPARSCPRNLPPAPTGGNSVGTDVRIWWESGNRTGFRGSQRRVPVDGHRLEASAACSNPCLPVRHAPLNPIG